ncbi:MAG: ABC transporter [Thermobacillus sp. ZCTH02-B1]|uniref:ABC transporter ATP-binding protein n=1 Tax=Thermobacillus sp. ZCTH02-B1 TaxID=1858795 RepID=UPI000B54EF43|nr:ABC transporter ATP-binding protein [Thermobacillus sp. ZCTH02-B1]OUM94632.1 MAG: ABC transporter [Thermobacillus sp. ZCTH02-B1]
MSVSGQPAVRLSGVRYGQSHFQLGPLDLEVPAGFVTAIVGPNSSGKSTTFRLMLDLMKPDEGSIEVLGTRIGSGKRTELLRRIGYLPEEPYRHDSALRGADKAEFYRYWYPDWDDPYYQDLIRLFEVNPSLRLGSMSKGMRRKFDLALTLAHRPELLLLDEPSSGLDPIAWRTMIDILHRYMESGERTILIATHVVEEVKRLADYIVFMVNGRVLGMFEKDETLTSWHQYYFMGSGEQWLGALSGMPGLAALGETGGIVRAVTSSAREAEAWLAARGLEPAGRNAMELDEILAVLVEREKTVGLQGTKGVRT